MNENAGRIFLYLCILAAFVYAGLGTVFASNAYECKSTTLIELYTNECEECPACPPVWACGEGYSCQSDALPGEVQQYPPEPGEAWVNSSVPTSTLTDVALNDARWGGREVGEVYARENKDFIVWYWPNGGDAIFDTTSLGKSHKWYDYTYGTGKSNSGNAFTSNTKLPILFHNPSGISIFERAGTTPGSVCAEFLAKYTNPEQVILPANRVYPMGQKMMLTAWLGRSDSDLEKMKNHGFSMQGPQWDTRSSVIDSVMRKAKSLGLRAAYRLVDNGGSASKLLPYLDNGEKEAMLYRNIKGGLLNAINKPDYNDQIDVWLTGTEELSTNNTDNVDKFNRYLKNVQKIVQENDPQQRPLWMSDVTGVSKSSMMVTHKYLDMVGPQIYLGRIDPNGSGYTTDAVMGGIARTIVGTAKKLDVRYPGKYPHAATGSLDALYEPIPSRDGAVMIDKIVEHWMYLGFNNGMQGYQFYAWHNYLGGKYADTQTWNWLKDAYYKHVKKLTDYKLDYVYLWGNRRKDLSMKILSGPEKIKGYPSISMQNIQYGNERFVILTNSADEAVLVEVNGFPKDCVKTLDIHTGKYAENHGSVNLTLQPLDVRLFRFDSVSRVALLPLNAAL